MSSLVSLIWAFDLLRSLWATTRAPTRLDFHAGANVYNTWATSRRKIIWTRPLDHLKRTLVDRGDCFTRCSKSCTLCLCLTRRYFKVETFFTALNCCSASVNWSVLFLFCFCFPKNTMQDGLTGLSRRLKKVLLLLFQLTVSSAVCFCFCFCFCLG